MNYLEQNVPHELTDVMFSDVDKVKDRVQISKKAKIKFWGYRLYQKFKSHE